MMTVVNSDTVMMHDADDDVLITCCYYCQKSRDPRDPPPPPPSPPPKPKSNRLPPNWKTARDADGKVYYYHSATRSDGLESSSKCVVSKALFFMNGLM